MKNLIFLYAFLFLTSSFTNEPCDLGCLQSKAQIALSDFTFIKQFPLEISGGENKVEISYVMSENATYRLAIADNETKGKRMIIKLLDRDKKTISTNIVAATRQFAASIDFVCPATGVYYIHASVEKSNSGSGLVILGYKKTKPAELSADIQ